VVMWDGTTQDGVKEMMPQSEVRVPFNRQRMRSGDGSLLAVKVFQ